MKKWGVLCALAITLGLALASAAPAFGVTVAIENPDAAYLARTTKVDFSALPDGTAVTSATAGDMSMSFGAGLTKRTAGVYSPDVWGDLGQVEEAYPAFLKGGTTATMELSRPVYEFGFEAGPPTIGTDEDFTAVFVIISGGQVVDTVSRTINGPAGNWKSRLFAIRSDVPFDAIGVITSDANGLGIAQLRFSEVAPTRVAVSGTITNASTGVGIPFAQVRVEHGGGNVTFPVADYRGRYSVTLLPGAYTFTVDARGWGLASQEVTVPDSPTFTQDFALATQYSQPVYRFFNMKAGTHFFTASDSEFADVFANKPGVFKYDGVAYDVALLADPSAKPLYRFFNRKSGVHLYTADEAEKANVIARLSKLYTYEGVAYTVRTDGLGATVHRFYVPSRNAHFYTVDRSEISSAKLSNYYRYEGVAYYAGYLPR